MAFTNTSTFYYTASLWDFGDHITSTLDSPTHTYTLGSAYTVTLTVSGPGGSDTETKAEYIAVWEKHNAYFPLVLRKPTVALPTGGRNLQLAGELTPVVGTTSPILTSSGL